MASRMALRASTPLTWGDHERPSPWKEWKFASLLLVIVDRAPNPQTWTEKFAKIDQNKNPEQWNAREKEETLCFTKIICRITQEPICLERNKLKVSQTDNEYNRIKFKVLLIKKNTKPIFEIHGVLGKDAK